MKLVVGKLIQVEGKKLIHSSLFRFSFIVLFTVNLLILVFSESGNDFSRSAYRTFKKEYIGMETNEGKLRNEMKECDKIEIMQQIMIEQNFSEKSEWRDSFSLTMAKEKGYSEDWYLSVRKEYLSGNVKTYCNNLKSESIFRNKLRIELEQVASYHEFLDSIQQKVDDKKEIKFFSDNQSTYSKRELKKEEKDYRRLKNVVPTFAGTIGLDRVMGNFTLDICPCLLLTIISILLYIEEKKNGNIRVYRATVNGRGELFLAKVVLQFFLSFFVVLLFYGSCIFCVWKSYGAFSLQAPIQSIVGYQNCTMTMSIGQYISVFLLLKAVVLGVVSLLSNIIAILAGNYVIYYFGTGVFYLLGVLCYALIPQYTAFSWLRQINIIYVLQGTPLVKNYVNYNIMNYPVSHILVCLFVIGLFLSVSYMAGRDCYIRCEDGYFRFTETIRCKRNHQRKRVINSVFLHELYKMLIGNKTAFLLIGATILLMGTACREKIYLTEDEMYFKNYMARLQGEVTEEKRTYIQEEEKRIEMIEEKISELVIAYEKGEISEGEYKEETAFLSSQIRNRIAFQWVKERLEYLDESGDETYSFVNDEGWKRLFGFTEEGRRNDYFSALFCILIMGIGISGCFACDFECGMYRLQRVTVRGRKYLQMKKFLNALVVLLITMVINYVRDIILVIRSYGLPGTQLPARSIPDLAKAFGSGGSILGHYFMLLGVRFLAYCLVLLIMYFLAFLTKSTIKTMVLTLLLFAIPLGLSLLGVEQINTYSFNNLLVGNSILN